jgi:hypothetical protein
MFGRYSKGPLIHDINQVSTGTIEQEPIVPVRSAKVVCANYDAIVHDFPQVFSAEALRKAPLAGGCDDCAEAGKLCREAINAWLIRNSAFISRQQLLPNSVNSPIETGDEVRTAYRPPGYARGVVVPIDSPAKEGEAGYLDLKGVGVAAGETPSHQPYSSGLEYLGYALGDFFYGWLVDTIFARTCPGYHVLPVYAVLDLGFDIVGGWNGTAPAGLHVRRAHSRPLPEESLPMSGSDREKLMLHAELLLRAFGLSTTGSGTSFKLANADSDDLVYHGNLVEPRNDAERRKAAVIANAIRDSGSMRLEVMNVQATSGGDWDEKRLEIYDFGGFSAYRTFTSPVANLIRDAAFNIGRIIFPDQPSFVRPDPAAAVDSILCNRDSVDAYSFLAAQGFRQGKGTFNQLGIERALRLARLVVMRRNVTWARRRLQDVRDERRRKRARAQSEMVTSAPR